MKAAYEALTTAQKTATGVSLYSRYVNRPLGRLFAAVGSVVGLTPNQVTAISAVLSGVAVALIATQRPTPPLGLGVAALLVLGFAFDAADGQLARLTNRGSPVGEWLDHVVDAAKMVTLHAAVLIMAFRYFDVPSPWLLVPLGYQFLAVVLFAAGNLREVIGRQVGATRIATGPDRLRALVMLPADFGVLALSFAFIGWPVIFAVVYTGLLTANVVLGLLLLYKWVKELSRI